MPNSSSDTSPVLSLPLIQPAQAQKHVTHNEALDLLDALVQTSVLSAVATVPPAAPQEGDMYIVGPGATAAWAGQDAALARYAMGVWRFFAPQTGWRAWVVDAEQMQVFGTGGWQVMVVPAGQSPAQFGVNASADGTNRLTVSAPATLLNHEGGSHRLKINKAAPVETASLLFQSSFSGRAEMGLAGSDNWSIRVSADGTAWTTALEVAAGTGQISGAGVQATATDVREGRLVRTEGAGAAVRAYFGSYHSPSGGQNVDLAVAGDVALYSTANPGTWPVGAGTFLFVETQRMYLGNAVRQIATEYSGSGASVAAARQWIRLRSGGGTWSVWSPVFTHASAVGVVSQTAGNPTGALMERGSNANGTFVRFADGTMICTHNVMLSGGGAATISGSWTFPSSYAAAPAVTYTSTSAPAAGTRERSLWQNTGVVVRTLSMSLNSNWPAGTSETVTAMAIGRWF